MANRNMVLGKLHSHQGVDQFASQPTIVPARRRFINTAPRQSSTNPYYLLSARELDIVIYYHKKYLAEARKANEMAQQEQMAAAKEQERGQGFFVTDVDIEKIRSADSDKPDNDNSNQVEIQQAVQYERVIQQDFRSQSVKHMARPDGLVEGDSRAKRPWIKKKKGPKFLLDFRKDHRHDGGGLLEPLDRLKLMYRKQPQANRATFFIPSLKPRQNPQLQKIEAYFADCNLDFVSHIPLIKIPPPVSIDRRAKVQIP